MLDNMLVFASEHVILVSVFFFLVGIFIYTEMQRGGQSISPQELVNLVNRDQALVIDLRKGEQFRGGHIHGSENITTEQIEGEVARLQGLKDTPIVLVCELGSQASGAGHTLIKAGIKPVYRLAGGVDAWRRENLPLIKS